MNQAVITAFNASFNMNQLTHSTVDGRGKENQKLIAASQLRAMVNYVNERVEYFKLYKIVNDFDNASPLLMD